jgi:hypothetical protein
MRGDNTAFKNWPSAKPEPKTSQNRRISVQNTLICTEAPFLKQKTELVNVRDDKKCV